MYECLRLILFRDGLLCDNYVCNIAALIFFDTLKLYYNTHMLQADRLLRRQTSKTLLLNLQKYTIE